MADEAPCFTADDVRILEDEKVYSGFFKLHRYRLKHRLIDGGWSEILQRESLVRRPAVGVLPYDPYLDRVILVEQFRIGAMKRPAGPWLMELVVGIVPPGYDAHHWAFVETREEAGCELMEAEYVCTCMPSPGSSDELLTLYVGGVDSSGVGGRTGNVEAGEDIWVQTYSREEAWRALEEGYICHAPTIIALQWLQMNHKRLQEQWQ